MTIKRSPVCFEEKIRLLSSPYGRENTVTVAQSCKEQRFPIRTDDLGRPTLP